MGCAHQPSRTSRTASRSRARCAPTAPSSCRSLLRKRLCGPKWIGARSSSRALLAELAAGCQDSTHCGLAGCEAIEDARRLFRVPDRCYSCSALLIACPPAIRNNETHFLCERVTLLQSLRADSGRPFIEHGSPVREPFSRKKGKKESDTP